jgi:hypothetical protein
MNAWARDARVGAAGAVGDARAGGSQGSRPIEIKSLVSFEMHAKYKFDGTKNINLK